MKCGIQSAALRWKKIEHEKKMQSKLVISAWKKMTGAVVLVKETVTTAGR